MIQFCIGMVVGAFIGIVLMALLAAGGDGGDE